MEVSSLFLTQLKNDVIRQVSESEDGGGVARCVCACGVDALVGLF